MIRSSKFWLAAIVGIVVVYGLSQWNFSRQLQTRLAPDNTYHRMWLHLKGAEGLLSKGVSSDSDAELRRDDYAASVQFTEANKLAQSLETGMVALNRGNESYLPYRVNELAQTAAFLVQVQLDGKQLESGDVKTLRESVVRLLNEMPDPTKVAFGQALPLIRSVSSSDPTLVSIINKSRTQ